MFCDLHPATNIERVDIGAGNKGIDALISSFEAGSRFPGSLVSPRRLRWSVYMALETGRQYTQESVEVPLLV